MAAAFAVLPVVAALAPADPAGPLARARDLVAFERGLGVFPEPAMIGWLGKRPTLASVLLFLYVFVHVPATVGVLVWAWLERPAQVIRARNVFLATQAIVVAAYVLVPTAAPRMLLEPGAAQGLGTGVESAATLLQSPFAAMPSGHVAFAVFVAGTLVALVRNPVIRGLAVLYPVAVTLVTLVTANHFWVDAAAGALATGAAAALVLVPARLARPVARRASPEPEGA